VDQPASLEKGHLYLSDYDRELLMGERGPGAQMAMRIIVRMAEIQGVERLIDIEAAHIDSSLYMGPATLEFAEKLVDLGAKVSVPSTLNVSGVDEHGWMHWSVPPDWAENAKRQMRAYQEMGCIPTWTCAPYQTEFKPKFGLCQLHHRRTHRTLSRLDGHLRGDNRACSRRRAAFAGEPRRACPSQAEGRARPSSKT